MAKNEYEGAQLVLRSTVDVPAYDVTVSDLTQGSYAIPKENISLYSVKYISSVGINPTLNNDSLPVGSSMPDALLPLDVSKAYGENTFPKDVNQAVYLEVFAPKNAPAGTYTGSVTVRALSYALTLPLKVTIADYAIPDTPSTKNYFAQWGTEHYNSAEGDATAATTSYYETMLTLRMSAALPFEGVGGADEYVRLLRKYYNAPGFSSYKFFYEPTYSTFHEKLLAFNVPLVKTYLKAVAKASLEDRTDYLSKAFFYFSTFIDEPDTNPNVTWDMVRTIATSFQEILNETAEELDSSLSTETNYDYYRSTVRNSLVTIPDVLPGGYSIQTLKDHGAEDITACTSLEKYDNEEAREAFHREDKESWWYTCIGPKYPYPNFLANNFLTAPRLISWMQKAYDVDGFLLWDVNNYTDGDNNATPFVDCYTSLTDTMSSVSDGKIFYPGAPYGIQGPVKSLRAISYRDGMEDYEILTAIENIYAAQGMNADLALNDFYTSVFSGAIPTTSSPNFVSTRHRLFQTLSELRGERALLWKEAIQDETYTDIEHIVFAVPNSEAVVSVDDVTLAPQEDGYYHVDLDAAKKSKLEIAVTYQGETALYTRHLTSKNGWDEDFSSGIPSYFSVDHYSRMTSSTEVSEESGGTSLAIHFTGRNKTGYSPSFAVASSAWASGERVSEISLSLNLPFETDDSYSVRMVCTYGESQIANVEVGTASLSQGWNHISFSIPDSISSLSGIREFRFYFPNPLEEGGEPSEATIYLDRISSRIAIAQEEETTETDTGMISVQQNTDPIEQGDEKNAVLSEDVSNVMEETDGGDRYLMLGDYENYNQIAQLGYRNNFGAVSVNTDPTYITHGNGSLRIDLLGRGESQLHLDPTLVTFTMSDYFQKMNYNDVDRLEVDFYNATETTHTVRFGTDSTYFSKFTTISSFELTPGWNHLNIEMEPFLESTTSFSAFYFFFQRGETATKPRVFYMDRFVAHFKA